MATKIQLTTELLRSQEATMRRLYEEQQSYNTRITAAINKMNDGLTNALRHNISSKANTVISQASSTAETLNWGADAIGKVVESYERVEGTLQNLIEKFLGFIGAGGNGGNNKKSPDFSSVSVEAAPDGYCNMAAVANLLNRKQLIDGKEGHIDYKTIYEINGGTKTDASAQWTTLLKTGIESNYGYSMKYVSGKQNIDSIKNLLLEHPEGIVIYSQGTYKHGIVLSYENGEFYSVDSVNGIYGKYADSWNAQKNGLNSVESLLANASCIYYINGTSTN